MEARGASGRGGPGTDGAAPSPSRGGARRSRRGRDAAGIAGALRDDAELGGRFSCWQAIEARAGATERLPERLHPDLAAVLRARGHERLWSHQARALELALAGRDVLVATPTASGKTLCYTAPGAAAAARDRRRGARAVAVPDQGAEPGPVGGAQRADRGARASRGTLHVRRRHAAVGAAHAARRAATCCSPTPGCCTRASCRTTPSGRELFRDLETIVIDEVHTLSGVFGSSVANVLRRLLRIAAHYGARPALPAVLGDAARARASTRGG